ncbi:MAG: hypothetical protein M1815_000944 [Lichina confinis]|nr:MAG: hypothetical protein M1815_000944 [Lichina confinis]
MVNVTALPVAAHPYYPVEAEIVGYLANEYSTPVLLTIFIAGIVAISSLSFAVINANGAHLRTSEKSTALWFILTGCIHLFFEGYFAWNHRRMGPMQDIFGQLWKEYAYSDSRYLTSDPFVLCMETLTAFCWGPLSFLVAWYIITGHPLRHSFQSLVSIGQIYGDILYYATCCFNLYHLGLNYSRPEFYYFWGYFFFVNFIWIVIPGTLLYNSFAASADAFRALDKVSGTLERNGAAKKTL